VHDRAAQAAGERDGAVVVGDGEPGRDVAWVIRFGLGQPYRNVGATRVRCVRSELQ
jgi:hypothetical protein